MLVNTNLYGDLILLTTPILATMKESIGFATDVFESTDGTEQRTPLKDHARQTLSFSSRAIKTAHPQFFNTQWGGIRQLWAIPLWSESQSVGTVSGDFITCATDIYDFRDSSLAVLKNSDGFTVVEITTVDDTGINLSAEIDEVTNATLMPVRVCFVSGDITRNTNGWFSTSDQDFIVIDEPTITPTEPDQFLDDDIYWFKLLYDGDGADMKITQQQNTLDSGIGVIYQSTDWETAQYSKDYKTNLKSKQQVYDYKDFLFRRQGKFRPFWLPTYELNLRNKSTGTVSTTLLIEIDQYQQLATSRKHIAIYADGEWTAHTISASSFQDASTVALTIDPALGKDASTIKGISYLGLHRLDADSVTLNHKGGNIVEVSVSILEIGA